MIQYELGALYKINSSTEKGEHFYTAFIVAQDDIAIQIKTIKNEELTINRNNILQTNKQ